MELSIPSAPEQSFLLIPIHYRRQPVFLSLHFDMVSNELNSRMPLQQEIRYYIPLESTCCLFVACCHEFLNRESYYGFILLVEREL